MQKFKLLMFSGFSAERAYMLHYETVHVSINLIESSHVNGAH